MYETYDEKTSNTTDRVAWTLCQIIDDDAPLHWRRYRFFAECIANNSDLMQDLLAMSKSKYETDILASME